MKEYQILDLEFTKKYQHACLKWYMQKHKADMDGRVFTVEKPAKNIKEKALRMEEKTNKNLDKMGKDFDQIANKLSEKSVELSAKASVKAK